MLIPQQKITPNVFDLVGSVFTSGNLNGLRKSIVKKNLFWTGSGRSALRHVLSTIGAKNVGLPSFTCHVILDAVKNANCEAVFIDSGVVVSLEKIKEKIKELDTLVLPYNFGFMPDVEKIVSLCKKNNVTLIEDCAQALGSRFNGKLAGSFGDYSFHSFGISKNLGFLGGMISTNKLFEKPNLPRYPIGKLLKVIGESLVGPLFFNKHYYPFVFKFLEKELQGEEEELNYSMSWYGKKVVLQQFKKYDRILRLRRENASLCLEGLHGVVDFVKPVIGNDPAWLYFCFFVNDRDDVIKKLIKENVDIRQLYTFKDLSGEGFLAKKAEDKHMCFSLYRSRKDVKYIIKTIKKVCG